MNRKLPIVLAMVSAIAAPSLVAQAPSGASATAPSAAAPAAVPPQAVPAKIAIIALQAVIATQRGPALLRRHQQEVRTAEGEDRERRRRDQLAPESAEGASRQHPRRRARNRPKDIDTKEKALQRDSEDAQNAYNQDMNRGRRQARPEGRSGRCEVRPGKRLHPDAERRWQPAGAAVNPVLWWQPTTDITQAVVNAYNASSGVAAPPPSAPCPDSPCPAPGAQPPHKK